MEDFLIPASKVPIEKLHQPLVFTYIFKSLVVPTKYLCWKIQHNQRISLHRSTTSDRPSTQHRRHATWKRKVISIPSLHYDSPSRRGRHLKPICPAPLAINCRLHTSSSIFHVPRARITCTSPRIIPMSTQSTTRKFLNLYSSTASTQNTS